MQVSPLFSPSLAPGVPARADRQDASREPAFGSVYEAGDRAAEAHPDAVDRRGSEARSESRRDSASRRDEAVKPADAAQADDADAATGESPAQSTGFPAKAEAEVWNEEYAEAQVAGADSPDQAVAVAEAPARPATASVEAAAEKAALATRSAAAAQNPAAAEAPADAAETQASDQPAAAPVAATAAAPRTALKLQEAEHVVVRRVRNEEAAGEAGEPRIEAQTRETEIRAIKPVFAAADSLARPSADHAQPLPELAAAETRASPEQTARADATVRHEVPRPVMTQVAEAARALRDGPVELTLQPEELGKVRMTMSTGVDGSMTMSLHAERPETLDLMRRNIGDLARELAGLGFSNLSFSFGQDRAPAGRQQPGSGVEGDHADLTVASVPLAGPGFAARPSMSPVSGGLDLRL